MEKSEFETNPSTMMIVPEGSVVYKHTALSVTESDEEVIDVTLDEIADFESRQRHLDNEIKEVSEVHAELHTKLNAFALEVNAHPTVAPEIAKAQAAEQELQLLSIELAALHEQIVENEKTDEEREREALDDNEEEEVVEEEATLDDEDKKKAEDLADDISTSRGRRRACKKLFQKIAGRTHPDKTSDIELTKIFIVAKEHYKKFDLEALDMLWELVKGNRNSLRKRWMAKIANRQKELDEIHSKIRALLNADAFKLMEMSHSEGIGRVCLLYSQQVRGTARQLQMNVEMAKQQIDDAKWRLENPGKTRPKPSRIQNIGGAYFVMDPWSDN